MTINLEPTIAYLTKRFPPYKKTHIKVPDAIDPKFAFKAPPNFRIFEEKMAKIFMSIQEHFQHARA